MLHVRRGIIRLINKPNVDVERRCERDLGHKTKYVSKTFLRALALLVAYQYSNSMYCTYYCRAISYLEGLVTIHDSVSFKERIYCMYSRQRFKSHIVVFF
jgi:hypothetical protein